MKDILIFKTDRVGDLINISPVIYNIKKNFPYCKITLICSEYNLSIANYYSSILNIMVYKKPFVFFLLSNLKFFFTKKFDLILQLDGKNHSYFSSIFIRSKFKYSIKFIKNKSFLGLNFNNYRPNKFLCFFFDYLELSYENYKIKNNKSYHYLSLYLNLLIKLNIKIFSKDHFLPFVAKEVNLPSSFYHFHIDERWSLFNENVYTNLKKKIETISEIDSILITSNLNGNKFFNNLQKNLSVKNNIFFRNDASLDDLINIIYRSHTVISSHSGLIVHVAASFKKKIIDIVSPDIFDELDRWIPFNSNYLRLDLNNFLNTKF